MDRSKIVAILTGAISVILAIAYLIIVQLLDMRGEMIPAPQSMLAPDAQIAFILPGRSLWGEVTTARKPHEYAGRSVADEFRLLRSA